MNGTEAIGEAITGGMLARTAEPHAGEGGVAHGGQCLNCRADLAGSFCHRCGQSAHVHRSLGAFWHDLLHGVLHFEGKIWRTLPLLAWRPGELTRRYVEGERANFVSPIALFLFSVFLMFAVFSWVGGPFSGSLDPDSLRTAQTDMEDALTRERAQLLELQRERAEDLAKGAAADVAEADQRISEARKTIAALEELTGSSGVDVQAQGDVHTSAPVGENWYNAAYQKAKRNPSLLLYKLQSNGYKFSWLLIPLSVPFLWVLFLHRRRYRRDYGAYDHLVFITYSIAFMSLGLIALSLMRVIGVSDALIMLAIFVIPPIHIYRQLRGAYTLSRWSALWRAVILVHFTTIVLLLFGLFLLTLGMMG